MAGPIDLDALRTFHAVHRTGSMTAAAALLGVSQPTVTARLQQLEGQAGRRLFDRGAYGCRPTAAANELAGRLLAPLAELESIAAQLSGEDDLSQATLRIGAPAELTERVLAPAFARLAATRMRVRLTLGLADDLLTQLATGHVDVVVSTVKPPARTAWQAIDDEEFVLIASPGLASGIDQEALVREPARVLGDLPRIAIDEQQSVVRRWWRHVLGTPPPGEPRLVVPDLRAAQALVEAGAGVSVVPRYLCADAIAAGRLVVLLEPEDVPINTLYLVTLPVNRHRPPIAAAWDVLIAPRG